MKEANLPLPVKEEFYMLTAQVLEELRSATDQHGPVRGPHEGWAVIFEELDELWDEVRAKKHDREKMKKEAVQVAAMAMRFVLDVCDKMPAGPEEEHLDNIVVGSPTLEYKPHKGRITNYRRVNTTNGRFYYEGTFLDHPVFRGLHGHTSMVVQTDGSEIETLNSRYTLVTMKE